MDSCSFSLRFIFRLCSLFTPKVGIFTVPPSGDSHSPVAVFQPFSATLIDLIRAPALRASAALKPGRVPRSSGYVHPHWRAFGVRQKFVTLFHQTFLSVRHSASCSCPRDRHHTHAYLAHRRRMTRPHRTQAERSLCSLCSPLPLPSPPLPPLLSTSLPKR